MPVKKVLRQNGAYRVTVSADNRYTLIICKDETIRNMEFEDVYFVTNASALRPMLHDRINAGTFASTGLKGSLVDDLVEIFKYIEANPGRRLFVTGHCDTTGTLEYNVILSEWRAQALLGIIDGDRDLFITASYGPHFSSTDKRQAVMEPIHREILSWCSAQFLWPCDPVNFPTTSHAVLAFQKNYNSNGKAGNGAASDLDLTAVFDKPTWGALYDCYNFKVAELLKKDVGQLDEYRVTLKVHKSFISAPRESSCFYFVNHPFAGCGEYRPVEEKYRDNYRSQANRRVETLFIPADREINVPCTAGECVPEECLLCIEEIMPLPPPGGNGGGGTTEDRGLLYMLLYGSDGDYLLSGQPYTITTFPDNKKVFTGKTDEYGLLRHDNVAFGEYCLNVEGCFESTPITVIDKYADQPQVRFLETARLSFTMTTDEDIPMAGVDVQVQGVGQKTTDEDGVADFGYVKPGFYDYIFWKEGYAPVDEMTRTGFSSSDGTGTSHDGITGTGTTEKGGGNLQVKNSRLSRTGKLASKAAGPIVTIIEASIDSTRSIRDPSKKLLRFGIGYPEPTDDTSLPSSTTDDKNLQKTGDKDPGHPPVVLVRGGGVIKLKAITIPENAPVDWTIEKNHNPRYVTPGLNALANNHAEIATDQIGSYSVTAKIRGGKSQIVWNFILVAVQVDADASNIQIKNDFKDVNERISGVSARIDGASSGVFPKQTDMWGPGVHAWSSEVFVNLLGGGDNYRLGIEKVSIGYLQNLTHSDIMAHYDDGATAIKVFNGPYVDTNEKPLNAPVRFPAYKKDGQIVSPVIFVVTMCRFEGTDDIAKMHVYFGDSPATGWEKEVSNSGGKQRLCKLTGYEKYRACIASFSSDAPNMLVAHAEAYWCADYTGTVEYQSGASVDNYKYDPGGSAHMTAVDKQWKLLWTPQNGRECSAEGFEVCPPLTIDWANGSQQTTFK